MAPKKAPPPSQSTIPIGNCEVSVEANKFTCKSEPNSLLISISKRTSIKISVKDDKNSNSTNNLCPSKSEERGEEYDFALVNPNDADSSTRHYVQEVLEIYTRELPAMNYAANTGKQSMFLKNCVTNGKYCTLLLKFKCMEGYGKVVAAITYKIIPANTQFAEVPLAAVSSVYQHKGFGHILYMELKKRLKSVGVHTILCWGDEESEGFWLKQGFVSIGQVDTKGRPCRLPIKADIRRALCFPGGSTLMVAHLNKGILATKADSVEFCVSLKPCEKSSQLTVNKCMELERSGGCYDNPRSVDHISAKTEACQSTQFGKDGIGVEETKLDGLHPNSDTFFSCGDAATSKRVEWSNVDIDAAKIAAETDIRPCSCSGHGVKRRVWEATLSSLQSKKIKGSHSVDCQLDSTCGLVSESDATLGISRSKPSVEVTPRPLVEVTPSYPVTSSCKRVAAEEVQRVCVNPAAPVSKELHSNGGCFRIMLMDIANDVKKVHLTNVIENLGGAVTSEGGISTHVVTGKVRKTLNFCTALCSGAWIVSPSWLKESFREGRFVDESSYILYDEDYVSKYKTELKVTVLRARARPGALLQGYSICMAGHVQPPVKTLSAIVKSAGGNVISRLDKINETSSTIVIACEEDVDEALSAVRRGIPTFSSEWLMNCIMKQELDMEAPQFAESL